MNPTERRIALCDIDHTLSAAWRRDHLLGQWDEYHSGQDEDDPIDDVIALIHGLYATGWTIIGLTARPEKWRSQTVRWLLKHDVSIDEVLMRPDDDHSPSPECKCRIIDERFPDKSEIGLILDDREDVCAALKDMGVTVLQVHARRTR